MSRGQGEFLSTDCGFYTVNTPKMVCYVTCIVPVK